jgi:aarF domain-containing kinase
MTLAESQDVLKACRAADFDVLNERYATTVLDIITSLRGYYIKLGQLGSLRSDFLPPQWIHELEKLQDSAPYADFSVVEEILCKDLGIASASEIFQSVDPVPLGAASIGQVHRAVLRDGRVVVVKVQYPGIEKTFETDMRTIRIFCEQAQPEQLPFLTEVEKQFMTEFDFRAEAANLQEVADNMAKSPFGSVVAVPRPLPELCGRAVVTMEFLPGPKLVDALRDMCRGMAEAEGVSLQEFMQKHQEAPPSSTLVAAHRAYHLVADGALNALKAAYNGTVGWVATPLAYSWTPRLLDIRGIVHTLLNVHAHQIVVDGVFNGDPHPGNILMLPDGRIGLIDFGQVKRLGLQKRMIFCHFVKALVDDDRPRAARLYQVMGHRTKRNSDEVLFELSRLGFNYDDEESRRGLNIEKFFESLNELDPVTQPGDDWVMVSRVSLLLRGLAGALHYPVRTAEHFLPVCKTFQRQHRALDAWVDEYVAAMDAVAKDNLYGTPREAEMIRAMESRGEMLARQTK